MWGRGRDVVWGWGGEGGLGDDQVFNYFIRVVVW